MSHVWIAVTEEHPDDAAAAAALKDARGETGGFLAAWSQRRKPHRRALRADPRLIDAQGEPGWVSLVLAPPGVRIPFDDAAVLGARRQLLAGPAPDAVSALMRDASRFEGAITVARGPGAPDRLRHDPFARIFPARVLQAGAGVVGTAPPPVGPSLERYGSSNPWPADRFPGG